ncbi:MAG TPA: substrate-binding domain-containing protein, partial [Limnochordia bacterium]|nr:substrate-binding domain-containing protein [Limnochordia bacterium]HPZ80183.1 substrate-binding domain-containing protein [Limnochordia bacterium]HQE36764.1 substrate-binding domain-containing protein [Limnochordia bacterium]
LLSLLLVALLAVGLLAPTAAAQVREMEFVIITHSATIDFWIPLVKGAQDAAAMINAFDPTVKISVTHTGPSMFNVAEQVNIMENVIQAGVDGIISTLPDPTAFDEPVRRALEAGIPVIGTNADAGPDNPRLAYVGQSDYDAGRTLARTLIDHIGTSGKVAIGVEDLGHTSLAERLRGVRSVLDEYPEIEYTILQTSPDLTIGAATFETYLIANPDAKAIISVDANTQSHGVVIRNLGLEGKVISGGWDLVPTTIENIKDGYTKFVIDQQPYVQGFYPVMALYLYHKYGIAPANMDSGSGIVGPHNIDMVIELAEQGYR